MKVAVIILNWNGVQHGLLRKYLPSVIENTSPELGEVIVADNGSTDESLQVLETEFPQVRVIALPQNYGFAEGYNQAIAQIDHPYIVLLNDDVRVEKFWLDPLLNFLEQNPDTVAVQPKLLSDRNHQLFEYAGASGGLLDKLGYPFCRGRIFQNLEADNGQYDQPLEIDWATGACLMVRREAYLNVGGLDKHFFAHMEEIDLCWRLRRMGGKIMCIPEGKAYHLGGASLGPENPRKTKLNFRNSLLMLYKNLPEDKRSSIILRRKLLDGVAALNFLAHFQFGHMRAIWRAHREYSQMVRDIYSHETSAWWATAPRKAVNQPYSILYQYYIKGKKTYSCLVK